MLNLFQIDREKSEKIGNSVLKAQNFMSEITDPFHGIKHAEKTVEIALYLIKDSMNVDDIVILLSAWWHDVGRLYGAKNHEIIGATMLYNDLIMRGFDHGFAQKNFLAVKDHRWSMNPLTIEGKVIRDADKLALLDPERWMNVLEDPSYPIESLNRSIGIVKKLKKEILILKKSLEIYEKMMGDMKAANINIF